MRFNAWRVHGQWRNDSALPKKAAFFLKPNLNREVSMTSFGIPMDPCRYRFGWQSDLEILRAQMGESSWSRLSRLLEFSCTKPEWILLGFAAGELAAVLVLAAPNEFNLPLEIIRLYDGLDERIDSLRLFQMAIEKAKALGAHQLYCTIPEDSADAALISQMHFHRWRKVARFECTDPIDPEVRSYRSTEAGRFARAEMVALIAKASDHSADSQIEFFRRQLGGIADAEWTLQMIESTTHEPRWWRVAVGPAGEMLGIILPAVVFGELMVGFLGVVPNYRGQSIASFLLAEAWSAMKLQGHSILCAEADERNLAMHRALTKSQFSRRWTRQEWRLDL
jgi:GNAT superfamily N-acetyltransferase